MFHLNSNYIMKIIEKESKYMKKRIYFRHVDFIQWKGNVSIEKASRVWH